MDPIAIQLITLKGERKRNLRYFPDTKTRSQIKHILNRMTQNELTRLIKLEVNHSVEVKQFKKVCKMKMALFNNKTSSV